MSDHAKTTATEALRELIATDQAAASDYLVESFLTSAMLTLFHARRDARLTQTQVAQKLHTKQSAIARLEADISGGVSLRRYVEFALACGVLPFDMSLAPVELLRQFALTDPAAARTVSAVETWRSACQDHQDHAQPHDGCLEQLAERDEPTHGSDEGIASGVTSGVR